MRYGIIDELIVAIIGGFGISYDSDKVPERRLATEKKSIHYFGAALSFLKAQRHVGCLFEGPDYQSF